MRYTIFGAGAIGAGIGALLARSGTDVTLVARGEHLDRMVEAGGVALRWPESPGTTVPVRAVGHIGDVGLSPGDVVVLAMKSQDTAAALEAVGALGVAGLRIVCAQNGTDNERQALRYCADVYGCCVIMPAAFLEAGVVELGDEPVPGVLDVGRYQRGVDDTALRLAADLRAAGFASEAVDDIMSRKYRKLVLNLANAVDALVGPGGWRSPLAAAARAEAEVVYAAAGLSVISEDQDRQRRAVLSGRGLARSGGHSSSWQTLARGGRRIESDHLNGEIVLLGRLHGVATPVNAFLADQARWAAAAGAEPGSLDVAELESRAAGAGVVLEA